jgi:hypothetical protein
MCRIQTNSFFLVDSFQDKTLHVASRWIDSLVSIGDLYYLFVVLETFSFFGNVKRFCMARRCRRTVRVRFPLWEILFEIHSSAICAVWRP